MILYRVGYSYIYFMIVAGVIKLKIGWNVQYGNKFFRGSYIDQFLTSLLFYSHRVTSQRIASRSIGEFYTSMWITPICQP